MRALLPALVVLGASGLFPDTALRAQRWNPEDRLVLTSFHLVTSLARSERSLYAATPRGLQILDMVVRRWEIPSTAEDGYPTHEEPRSLAWDPGDRRVWLGTLQGNLYSFDVDFRRWTLEASPGVGPVFRMAWLGEEGRSGDALYLMSPSGWHRMSRFSLVPERVPPRDVPDVLRVLQIPPEERLARMDPAFAAGRGTLLMDENLQRWPLTDFVSAERQGLLWLATAGDGVYLFDSRFARVEPHRFGLLAPGVGALELRDGWIWFGPDGPGARSGVTVGRSDLQEWRWLESRTSGAPAGPVWDIETGGNTVWAATPTGVMGVDPDGGRWIRAGGLAGNVAARRLARTSDGTLWAATDRGLLRVVEGTEGSKDVEAELLGGGRIRAVLAVGDTLLVGGDFGVRRLVPGRGEMPFPAGAGSTAPTGPILDLARAGGRIWAAAPDALWRLDARGWSGPFREPIQGGVGAIRGLRGGEDALWVVGDGGAARGSPDGTEWRYLLVGRDLPRGPVVDALPVGELVYLAMPSGAVRLAWGEAF